jgi:hypothetical protein
VINEIKVLAKNSNGQVESFVYKPGEQHKANAATSYKIIVDGAENFPGNTKIVRKKNNIVIQFEDSSTFELVNWSEVQDSRLENTQYAQTLDASTGAYVVAKDVVSGTFMLTIDGSQTTSAMGNVAEPEAEGSSGFNPYYLAPLALLGLAAGGGGGGGGGDTPTESAKETARKKIETYANDSTKAAPTEFDYTSAGVNGVTVSNLTAINAVVAASTGPNMDTTAEVQAVVNLNLAAQSHIVAYANEAISANTPSLSDYAVIGVNGVTTANLGAINSGIDANTGSKVGTAAEVQAIVNIYKKIFAEANGAAPDATPTTNPTAIDYDTLTGNKITAIVVDPESITLLNSVIGGRSVADIDTVAEIVNLGIIVNKVMVTVLGADISLTPSAAEFGLLGVKGVTDANVYDVLNAILATGELTPSGSAVDTLAKLQALVDKVIAFPFPLLPLAVDQVVFDAQAVTHSNDQTPTTAVTASQLHIAPGSADDVLAMSDILSAHGAQTRSHLDSTVSHHYVDTSMQTTMAQLLLNSAVSSI